MKDITNDFGTLHVRVKAFVVFQKTGHESSTYVESYDINSLGFPVNAHPLSIQESLELARALDTSDELKRNFLKPIGLLPNNILYINPDQDGYVIWYTPPQTVNLFFSENLSIANGKASIPTLLWKATKKRVYIYGLKGTDSLNVGTELYYAPFFNIHEDGNVCMGTVNVDIASDCLLEKFVETWEQYFFTSNFSHLIGSYSPVRGNIVQLWQKQVSSTRKFPNGALIKNGLTIKNIIS